MMKDRYEVILAGSGGQGLVSCGIILAEAAILEGQNVVQTQSYGIASRGGTSIAEVIISIEEITFQQVQEPDVVLALTEQTLEVHQPLQSKIPIFYDTTLIKQVVGKSFYGYPFTDIANKLGHVGAANIIALGAMASIVGMVTVQSLAEVLRDRFGGNLLELNLKALDAGIKLAQGYFSH